MALLYVELILVAAVVENALVVRRIALTVAPDVRFEKLITGQAVFGQ